MLIPFAVPSSLGQISPSTTSHRSSTSSSRNPSSGGLRMGSNSAARQVGHVALSKKETPGALTSKAGYAHLATVISL